MVFISCFDKKHLFFYLIMFFSAQGFAQSLHKKITVVANKQTRETIIKKIEHEQKVVFSYESNLLPTDKINVALYGKSLEGVLLYLFKDINIGFTEIDGHIILYENMELTSSEKEVPEDELQLKIKSAPIKQVVQYIYDTVRKVIIDTVISYRYDTLLVKDTIIYVDTLKISPFEKQDKSRFSLNLDASMSFWQNSTISVNDESAINEKSFDDVSFMNYSLSASYYFKRFYATVGAGVHIHKEDISFSDSLSHIEKIEYVDHDLVNVEKRYVDYFTYEKIGPIGGEPTYHTDSVVSYETVAELIEINKERDTLITEKQYFSKKFTNYYISVPVMFGYKLPVTKRLSAILSTGVQMSFLFLEKQDASSENNMNYTVKWNSILFCSMTELGLTYKLDKRLSLTTSGMFFYDLNSRYASDAGMSRNISIGMLNVGVNYFF